MSAHIRWIPSRHDVAVDFTFADELIVECRYTPKLPATRSSPAEGGNEVMAVWWRGIDILGRLEPHELGAIEEKVNEP